MATRLGSKTAKRQSAGVGKRPVSRLRDRLDSKRSSRLLAALAEPERLRIIQCLEKGPCRCGGDLQSAALAAGQHFASSAISAACGAGALAAAWTAYRLFACARPFSGRRMGTRRLHLILGSAGLSWGALSISSRVRARADQKRKTAPRLPNVEGTWIGQWEPSGVANASTARGGSQRNQLHRQKRWRSLACDFRRRIRSCV